MNFLAYGIPLGRYFGINVRLHFTFCIYLCILLHEFGHALAARWCDGEANDILLWPLGGLAFVRPAWDPTAHLITTVAGPFVTFVLWLTLKALTSFGMPPVVRLFLHDLSVFNLYILLFNLIPAFPMDGGRILRDGLWHWMSAETATRIAVWVSRGIAIAAAVFAIYAGEFFFLLFPAFIFMQTMHEQQIVAIESRGASGFSIRDRLRRGRKQREFRQAVREHIKVAEALTFHRCETCGLTELTAPTMDFRVCPECVNGQEYCREHLDAHKHV